jgi:hypothetical protein
LVTPVRGATGISHLEKHSYLSNSSSHFVLENMAVGITIAQVTFTVAQVTFTITAVWFTLAKKRFILARKRFTRAKKWFTLAT